MLNANKIVFLALGASLIVAIGVLFNLLQRLARRYIVRSSQPIVPSDRVALSALSKATVIYWLLLLSSIAALFNRFDDDALPPSSSSPGNQQRQSN